MARPDMGVPDLDYPAHYRGSPCPGHGMVWSTSTWSDGCRQAYSLFSRTVGKRALHYIGRVPTVRDHVQPRRPSHGRTNGKSIFFCIYSPPFMLAWELDKLTECSAVQKGSAGNVVQ